MNKEEIERMREWAYDSEEVVVDSDVWLPLIEEIDRLNKKIDKAIEYINKHSKTNPNLSGLLVESEINELEQILKGDSNE